jgi:hypothetical protein
MRLNQSASILHTRSIICLDSSHEINQCVLILHMRLINFCLDSSHEINGSICLNSSHEINWSIHLSSSLTVYCASLNTHPSHITTYCKYSSLHNIISFTAPQGLWVVMHVAGMLKRTWMLAFLVYYVFKNQPKSDTINMPSWDPKAAFCIGEG